MIPQIGARGMFVTLISGQILGGMAFSQVGGIESEEQPSALKAIASEVGVSPD